MKKIIFTNAKYNKLGKAFSKRPTEKKLVRRITIIAILFTVFTVTSCKENLVNDNSGKTQTKLQEERKISSIQLDKAQSDFLDTIFSGKNELIPNDWQIDSNIYVINSQEELNKINPFYFDVNINWSKYILIGGRITISSLTPGMYISELEERENDYLLNIKLDYSKSVFEALGNLYFWRLYPKLKANKNMAVEIKRI